MRTESKIKVIGEYFGNKVFFKIHLFKVSFISEKRALYTCSKIRLFKHADVISPPPSVCLSVRLSSPGCTTLYGRVLGYPYLLMGVCTTEFSVIPRWILFSFGTWNKHLFALCLGVLFLTNLKNCNFGDFLKNGDFGDLAWLLNVVCMDKCSLIPRLISFFFGTWNEHILVLCLDYYFWKKSQKLEFWRFFEKWWFSGLSVIYEGSLYGWVLAYPSMDFIFLWHIEQTHIGAVLRRIIFETSQKL